MSASVSASSLSQWFLDNQELTMAHKAKVKGLSFSRLADITPFIVCSDAQKARRDKAKMRCVPILETMRKATNCHTYDGKRKNEKLTLAIRALSVPLWTVEVEGMTLHVSASVVRDWRRERIDYTVLVKPEQTRQIRGVNTRNIENEVIENQRLGRANAHSMGMAQNAWRYAHLENATATCAHQKLLASMAERVAYYWLYHGTLDACEDDACELCKPDQRRRWQQFELYTHAFRYLAEYGDDSIRRGHAKKLSHAMPKPTLSFLKRKSDATGRNLMFPYEGFVQESTSKASDATEERRSEPIFNLRDAIVKASK